MKKPVRVFVEVMAEQSPLLKPALQEADEYWAPASPPATTVLADCAMRLLDESTDPEAAETQRALLLIEAAMGSMDVDVDVVTAAATGFIEGLVASASQRDVLVRFLAALGPKSRGHADAWLAFTG